MARLRVNFQTGLLGASLAHGATTITFGVAPGFATLVSPDYYPLTLEPNLPGAVAGNAEIVYLTAYTAGATTGTVLRAQEGTVDPVGGHPISAVWTHDLTALDLTPDPTGSDITASAVGDAAVAGTVGRIADAGHKHGREAFATPGSSAVGDAAAAGSAATVTRSDHKHGRESFATNALALGTAATAGVSTQPIRSDDTILAFDATAPVASAPSDAAAVGSAVVTARRDHKHGREGWGQLADVTNVVGGASAVAGATGRVADAGHIHPQPDVLADVRAAAFGAFFDVVIVNDGGSDGSTANLNCSTSSPFRASYDVGKTVLANVPGASGARGDTCGTTSGSATVTDAAAVAGDVGKCVAGPGIPIGAWIISVVAATSFTLSTPATATAASVTLAVSLPLSTIISAVNSGSQAVLASGVATQGGALAGFAVQFGHDDTAAMQIAINAWGTNYAALKKTGWTSFATAVPTPILLPAGAAFVNATQLTMPAGLNFADGELILRGAGEDTTTIICIGTGAFVPANKVVSATFTQGSATVSCAGILAADAGCGISGSNIPKGAQVSNVVAGTSFVMTNGGVNLAAFASTTISITLQYRVPKFSTENLTVFGNYLGAPNGCGGGRSAGAGLFLSFPFPYQSQVMPRYPGLADGNAGANTQRNDANCGTTNLSATVTDAAVKAEDVGSVVTGTNIPANSVIVSVSPGVSFVMNNQATATGTVTVSVQLYGLSTATSATQLTDANAAWAVNQWVGAMVFIDEDKASNSATAFAGCGFATVTSNDATHLNFGALIPTRGGGTYVPSGQTVRYRIHTAVYNSELHVLNRVRLSAPRGFAIITNGGFHLIKSIINYPGQPQDPSHNDNFGGGAGTVYVIDDPLFDGGAGNYCDLSSIYPGLFARVNMKGFRSRNRAAGGLFCAGVGSVVNAFGLENFTPSGCGYDAITHESNRGNNAISGGVGINLNVNGSGLSSARSDRVTGCIAIDSPYGMVYRSDASCGVTNGSTTVTDTHCVASDAGLPVSGAGIPAGTTISSVTPGTSFVMSNAFTGTTGTQTVLVYAQPAVPATGVAYKNPNQACDCTVRVTANAGGTCQVWLNGVFVTTVAAAATDQFRVTSGTSVTLTYTSAPTWVWIGD